MKTILMKDLVHTVAESLGFSNIGAEQAIKHVLAGIRTLLVEKAEEDGYASLELRGFGTFYIRPVKPRKARNPRTGQEMNLPASRRVVFRPATRLRNEAKGIRK